MSVFHSRREFLALTGTADALALTGCGAGSGSGGPAWSAPGATAAVLAELARLREEHGTALL
ncbi:hypothetical protein QWM81_15380 [Streptomyces ficellus]|uniref:Twin-arginine translocation signal domain-containing protein n=1 Tax=Streptomyces ficellus TaxID=1977088 RepID=A0ABT7Z7D2_9ACTN|nr:hypothetical protein [Streptomyces ficellus]MDN3295410.1 hypothetical protein [Streptomyces ficellus]